jgi:hypothetical protein
MVSALQRVLVLAVILKAKAFDCKPVETGFENQSHLNPGVKRPV